MITLPSCYGKLPTLGDYLQHRAPAGEVGLWWNRFVNIPKATAANEPRALPWCFVLAPDVFSWAAGVHVIGALMLSRDRIGRDYPFIIWQKAKPQGLRQACLFGADAPKNWLFWLSRLLLAHVRPVHRDGQSPENFLQALDALWSLFRPAWTARFGVGGKLPPEERCHELVGPCAPLGDLEGVHFMPWVDWPHLLWEPRALCWFWQQDQQGRYLRVLRDHHFGKRVLAAML